MKKQNEQEWGVPKFVGGYVKLTREDLHGITDDELKEKKRRENIKKGMANSINKIGRPSKITEEMVKKAYARWRDGQISQKEIANSWGVSERTVRRKFAKLK